jgi:predicted ester cyclase
MFVEGGTHEDPITGHPVEGPEIDESAGRFFQFFPDFLFEIKDMLQGDRNVAIEGVMRGTNAGSFAGAPPTGEVIALHTAVFLRIDGDRLTSAVWYFDQRGLATQLGLQAHVMPRKAGPMRFGTSVRLDTGSRAQPGAISFTRIDMGSPQGLLRLREYARPVLAGMASMDSVLGAAILNDGQSVAYTVSAWPSPEAAGDIIRQEQHRAAMRAFFSDGLGVSAWTSVWSPARVNTLWVRCPACAAMVDAEGGGECACGAALPEAPPFF